MLFFLKQENGDTLHYLKTGKDYVVGRKNADIVISSDQSISRKHAVLRIGDNSITLIDCGSKYGTSHNSKKLEANSETTVNGQDTIKFGIFQSIYKIEKMHLVTTGSGLSSAEKSQLKKHMSLLGGSMLNDWDATCTHLTVQQIMLTVKVLHALIDDRPFVTLDYWSKFEENVKTQQPPPNVDDFKPQVAETLINQLTLSANPERKSLFKEKVFVFSTERVKLKMEDLVKKAGGSCVSWDKEPLSLLQVTSWPKKYIFIHSEDVKTLPQSLKDIHEHIMKLGQRTIPVQEIAMAIMLCSNEKDCNPNFNRVERVFVEEEDGGFSQVFPLASATQSQEATMQLKREVIIPASLEEEMPPPPPRSSTSQYPSTSSSSLPQFTSTPQKRNSEEAQGNAFKRMKLDKTPLQQKDENVTKKKREESDETEPKAKRSCLKENPFATLKKNNVSVADNPFAGFRVKREEAAVEDIKREVVAAKEKTPAVVEAERAPSAAASPEISMDQRKDSFSSPKSRWFSTTGNITIINITLQEVSSSFRDVTINESTERGKNVKKFKRKTILKPQTTILTPSVALCGGDVVAVVLSDESEEDEEPAPVVRRNTTKRFAL